MDEFEDLCRRCGPMVYRYLLSLCRSADLAEELTAETFYQAWVHIGAFRGTCKPETWLCQIAGNACRKELRRRRRLVPWETLEPETAGQEEPLPEALARKEASGRIRRLVDRLPEPYREVFLLRIFGELRFREIGDLMGRTESWAKVTFYRAKDRVIQWMEDEDGHDL